MKKVYSLPEISVCILEDVDLLTASVPVSTAPGVGDEVNW